MEILGFSFRFYEVWSLIYFGVNVCENLENKP